MIKILIADDHLIIRQGLRLILETETDFELIGEASDGDPIDVSDAFFSITAKAKLTISGLITTSGRAGIGGVTITFSNGGGTTTTAASGKYAKTVNSGWTGKATPKKAEYTFEPASRSYTNVITNQTRQDYTGTPRRRPK